MSKQALEALAVKFTALEAQINALTPDKNTDDKAPSDDYAAVLQKLEDLALKLTALEQDKADAKAPEQSEDFKALTSGFAELRKDFDAAVKKEDGTPAGEHLDESDEALDLY